MERKFGIELEIAGVEKSAVLQAVQNSGINIQDQNYNHSVTDCWKIVPDGSVENGFEIVSPILYGEDGLLQAKLVCEALVAIDTKINTTCGFHVHFDAQNFSVNQIKSIVTRYAKYENEIDSFMPKSRRENENRFCRSVIDFARMRDFLNATTIEKLAQIQGGRYFKLNLQSYTRHGTIEFRQHSGTCDALKVCNWIRFLDAFVTRSCEVADQLFTVNGSGDEFLLNHEAMNTGARNIYNAISDGAEFSVPYLMARLGRSENTITAQLGRIRRAGFTLRKSGNNFRLIRTVAVTQNAIEDSIFIGVNENQVTFYRNRAIALAA